MIVIEFEKGFGAAVLVLVLVATVIVIVFGKGCGVGVRLEVEEAGILEPRLECTVEEAHLSVRSCGLQE